MDNMDVILNSITDTIYRQVFGFSRDELIAKAKKIAGDDWNYVGWKDDDNAMRDWMSVEALVALRNAELEITTKIQMFVGNDSPRNVKRIKQIARKTASKYPVKYIWRE